MPLRRPPTRVARDCANVYRTPRQCVASPADQPFASLPVIPVELGCHTFWQRRAPHSQSQVEMVVVAHQCDELAEALEPEFLPREDETIIIEIPANDQAGGNRMHDGFTPGQGRWRQLA